MQPIHKAVWISIITLTYSFAPEAHAASRSSKARLDVLSIAGGIAGPTYSTAVLQNPAGIVNTPGVAVIGQTSLDSSGSQAVYSGGLSYGDKLLGVTAGARMPSNSSDGTSMYYGIALGGAHSLSMGLSGISQLKSGGTSQYNFGVSSELDPFTFGLTVHNLGGDSPEMGAGIRFDFEKLVSLVVDASYSPSLSHSQIQPGFAIGDGSVNFTLSYGFGSGSTQLSSGVAGGVSLKVDSLTLQAYYNQLSTTFISASFVF